MRISGSGTFFEHGYSFFDDRAFIYLPVTRLSLVRTSEAQVGRPPVYMSGAATDIFWGPIVVVMRITYLNTLTPFMPPPPGHSVQNGRWYHFMGASYILGSPQIIITQRFLIDIEFDSDVIPGISWLESRTTKKIRA